VARNWHTNGRIFPAKELLMMSSGFRVSLRLGVALLATVLLGMPAAPGAAPQPAAQEPRHDFDIRERRSAVPARAAEEDDRQRGERGTGGARGRRLNRETGTVRVLDRPAISAPRTSSGAAIRTLLAANARQFGLERRDLNTLTLVRDYSSRSTGLRHVLFRQEVDGIPVFDSAIAIHLLADGTVARVTSNAAPIDGRTSTPVIGADRAREEAAAHAGNSADNAEAPSLAWLPVDGVLRLAWHVEVPGTEGSDLFDILIDAQTAELLLRRNRTHQTAGFGRVFQGAGTASVEPRRPDPMPFGADGMLGCPPPVNFAVRNLTSPFRDPSTVLASTGHLEGNNVKVFRGSIGESAEGSYDGQAWLFDFPFNSPGSAETVLFFGMNYAHDFYYDLGFDEAAGNFQVDNFGRGGVGGDPVRAKSRAVGRNNANYVHAPDGRSPTINMFLWDALGGCWGEDVDNDGWIDLDGDYDLDVILHEYHHGVSLRVNTSFGGPEAGAIGEGGGDFFAYSVNNNTILAEYSRPGGLRGVNNKGYGDWWCSQTFFCEVHDNGEIWANVMWDVRERFRTDLVRGSESAGINESHQLYVDALKLSPPRPTMLDMRDSLLEADAVRNPAGSSSANFCRIWESFAGRGMGVNATDTEDNGSNRVGPGYNVPAGCQAPPIPRLVTVTALAINAFEAGPVPGTVVITRSEGFNVPLTVNFATGGTAKAGTDYVVPAESATIPAGAASVIVPIVPIDDPDVESTETVIFSLRSGNDYAIGSPAFTTINIVSNDVAPDLVVTSLVAPAPGGAGATIEITETTRNQGTGTAAASQTLFYLSSNFTLDSGDPLIGSRAVGELASGASNTSTVSLVLPNPLASGTYYLYAKADGPETVSETNEWNNTRLTSLAIGPDLVVTSISAPTMAAPGGAILVSDTTVNNGGGPAPASKTRFFLSVNILLDSGDTPLQARDVGALAVGASSSGTTSVTIPAGTTAGNYYLFAQADGDAELAEPNEANNARQTTIRVGADLTVSAFTAPARAGAGSTIAVTDTTRNSGAGPAAASSTAFYLSPNLILDASDIPLQSRPVPALAANAFSTVTTNVMLPNVPAGAWYLLANADDGHDVPEGLETNNVRFTGIQIGPDLTFTSVAAPSSGVSGAPITITDTIRNIGAVEAPASTVRFYLSVNLVLDASDIQLGASRGVPVVAPNTSNTGSSTMTLPAGMVGNFYVLIVADGDQTVAESNEFNNVVARFIQIASGS
jgi:subtilase family serine protease